MENKFVQEIKEIEAELLALKTGSDYTSIRPASYATAVNVTTGVYQINYEAGDEQIFSIVACTASGQWIGMVFPHTPGSNSQIVEISTTHMSEDATQYITETTALNIISNRPVTSVQRL